MQRAWRMALFALVTMLVAQAVWLSHAVTGPNGQSITGLVRDGNDPVAGAAVRVQATANRTRSATDGSFVLENVSGDEPVTVTAWAPGYFIGWAEASPGARNVRIDLQAHFTGDNPSYKWFSREGVAGSRSCGHCMPNHFEEWQADAHSQSAVNPRFLTTYNGTDVKGNKSPVTRRVMDPDYGSVTLSPDRTKPYYGPGYKLDFPNSAGNCATCHVPAAALGPGGPYAGDINNLSEIEKEGVFCELCHKIGDVMLDEITGLPQPNMPGTLSMRLYRPETDEELFFGTFDDVTRRVSYLPLQEQSAFCAPCHFGVFWDTIVYNSYGEWLASPYSDPQTGQTCQDCHMPVTQDTHFVLPEQGGLERKPGGIFNHRMPGAADVALLQDTAKLEVTGSRRAGLITARVRVTNDKGGHHIPTDHPSRNILLVVSARDARGARLEHLGDQLLPSWAGEGAEPDDYAGRPGKGYAKILEETWTGVWPSIAYWNPTIIREDTRIAALATDTTDYEFRAPADGGIVTIEVRLIFRRAFKELARQKSWDIKDILMERETVAIP